jgi:low temperature requirement protein LtrA
LIVAIGESVAAIGIGAAGPVSKGPVSWQLLGGAVLGLVVAAALWWIVFGSGDDERAGQVLTAAASRRRTQLALGALFYGNIPLLLGLVALAAGILRAVLEAAGHATAGPEVAQAAVLAVGAALFLAGDVVIRLVMHTGPTRVRIAAAAAALATTAAGATLGLEAQLLLVAAVLIAPLITDRQVPGGQAIGGPPPDPPPGPVTGGRGEPASADTAG